LTIVDLNTVFSPTKFQLARHFVLVMFCKQH